MTLAIYIGVTFLVITWVALPVFKAQSAHSAMDEIQSERAASLMQSLKELYDSREKSEEMADDDFANIERRLILDLARIYHQQGILPGTAPAPTETDTASNDSDPQAGVCADCNTPIDPRFKFCPKCGLRLQAA